MLPMQHKQMVLYIIELVVGVLQMPFARRLENLPPMQYTIARNKQDFAALESQGGFGCLSASRI